MVIYFIILNVGTRKNVSESNSREKMSERQRLERQRSDRQRSEGQRLERQISKIDKHQRRQNTLSSVKL